jgi:hypothetical protein
LNGLEQFQSTGSTSLTSPTSIQERTVGTRALGPVGERVFILFDHILGSQENFSITLLTSLKFNSPTCCLFTFRTASNTAHDFLSSLYSFLEVGVFDEGDYLILDNASIHDAEEIQQMLWILCEKYSISIVFLPTYSPELDPAELVFSHIKRWIEKKPYRKSNFGGY